MKALLTIENISKSFGGVLALREVAMEIAYGECHALVGENGAGKTTLINILNGAIEPDSGKITIEGEMFERLNPLTSIEKGINVIHQELALIPSLTVAENIFLGNLGGKLKFIVRNERLMKKAAQDLIDSLVFGDVSNKINASDLVYSLSTSKKQIVEIVKAIASNPKLLIMDEPTASLTQGETEKLFELIRKLKGRGISVVFVSHRLNEVMEIADRVSVLRDGKYIGTIERKDASIDKIITMMVGRELELYETLNLCHDPGEVMLKVNNLTHENLFRNISFEARRGEILGFAGLVGSGRSEVAQAIFGFIPVSGGEIEIKGKKVKISSPKKAMKLGIGLLPEDRKIAAAIDTMNVRENLSIVVLPELSRLHVVDRIKEDKLVKEYVEKLRVKAASVEDSIHQLSGGNQQKIMFARWLATKVDILIVDEPTQGVDVGAKAEIHKLLRQMSMEGKAVIVISSDLPEVLAICDRIVVMKGGEIAGELICKESDAETIMTLATVNRDKNEMKGMQA